MNVFINTYGVLVVGESGMQRCRLLVVVHGLVAMLLDEFVVLGGFEVFADHFGDEFVKADCGGPAEFGFGGLAEQGFDFGVPH